MILNTCDSWSKNQLWIVTGEESRAEVLVEEVAQSNPKARMLPTSFAVLAEQEWARFNKNLILTLRVITNFHVFLQLLNEEWATTKFPLQSAQAKKKGCMPVASVKTLFSLPVSLSSGGHPRYGSTRRSATSSPMPDGRGRPSLLSVPWNFPFSHMRTVQHPSLSWISFMICVCVCVCVCIKKTRSLCLSRTKKSLHSFLVVFFFWFIPLWTTSSVARARVHDSGGKSTKQKRDAYFFNGRHYSEPFLVIGNTFIVACGLHSVCIYSHKAI